VDLVDLVGLQPTLLGAQESQEDPEAPEDQLDPLQSSQAILEAPEGQLALEVLVDLELVPLLL
jgi:hypothetical protein